MTQWINITPLHLVSEGERGSTYDFSIRRSDDLILIKRKANTINGNTYHQGISPKTNPKKFFLLEGRVEFSYRHRDTEQHYIEIIEVPSIIEIQPLVTHAMKALSNILVLECNGFRDIESDRYRLMVIPE